MALVTDDDRLRAVGIMFREEMRPLIGTILSKHPRNRSEVDEWTGQRNLAFHHHHQLFIDRDVLVHMPEIWSSNRAKEKVDEFLGEGTCDSLSFNPNNHERIPIAWTKKDTQAILTTTLAAYTKSMVNYTKHTGGGEYATDALGSIVYFLFSRQNVHLSVVHIWDKQFSFPLADVTDELPQMEVDDVAPSDATDSVSLPTLGAAGLSTAEE